MSKTHAIAALALAALAWAGAQNVTNQTTATVSQRLQFVLTSSNLTVWDTAAPSLRLVLAPMPANWSLSVTGVVTVAQP